MRYLRYGPRGLEKPGLLDGEGRIRDLSGLVRDIGGVTLSQLPAPDPATLPLVEGTPRLGVPVAGVGKIVCVGLNYSDHAAETGMAEPEEPILFMKATSALCGPDDTVRLPRGATKGDWEVELGIVIGKRAQYVSEEDALSHVAGYTIVNDVSERAFQIERGGTWTKGKSCDTFAPVGPWLVTPEEVGDPQDLRLSLDLNGVRMQSGTTAKMIFGAAQVISYISQMMTLHPGDIIATGTPPGVGMGLTPPRYLREGDVMELAIEKLGRQRQQVVQD
ncbi:fumarylacetoacetate hydrolase family protein [Pseudooceanicola sp. CBS1P-1]|uniref:2-hydroxyhepta-2,4-diene-1,7-dioate isomerase n=1 Tax=Pseudooceanicola albus TaxID=2692189 RepID=A0A6L7G0F5_9RHOB|nr:MULTISPECIES: fumarylacetoacetate hydrolase family protein [Pseudooceanicola]MBT9383717.1 fumarylacetoacetate hydrolase family protein [Pseudooceanicola endophyticus]MXN17571.1 2-hydroxyhepta-2,4-diene-1,7-dioate isomerase [Pseudooceanicola albus]